MNIKLIINRTVKIGPSVSAFDINRIPKNRTTKMESENCKNIVTQACYTIN